MRIIAVFAVAMILGFTAFPAQAGHDSGGGLIFTDEERHVIREVLHGVEHLQNAIDGSKEDPPNDDKGKKKYKNKDGGLPPGLAKRDGDLPPGLEMQIKKNGRLPPGLEKRALPDDLRRRLGPPRKGTGRYIVNDDVVLIEEATGVILDIIENVFGD